MIQMCRKFLNPVFLKKYSENMTYAKISVRLCNGQKFTAGSDLQRILAAAILKDNHAECARNENR